MKGPTLLLLMCLLLGISAASLAQENKLPEIKVIEAEVDALLPGLEALAAALVDAPAAEEKRLLAKQIASMTAPIQADFALAYAEYDENDRLYLQKMGSWIVFEPYGFGTYYLVEALQAQQANSKIKLSPYRAKVREIHRLAGDLGKADKPRRQQRLEKALLQQINGLKASASGN